MIDVPHIQYRPRSFPARGKQCAHILCTELNRIRQPFDQQRTVLRAGGVELQQHVLAAFKVPGDRRCGRVVFPNPEICHSRRSR